jgi:hypothetical protein
MSDQASQRAVLAYIDSVESGVARLLLRDSDGEWRGHALPAAILPADAREGSWLEISLRVTTPPKDEDGPKLRHKLGQGDKGGDIVL